MKQQRWKRIFIVVLSYFLALAFIGSGGAKLATMEPLATQFANWGLPFWMMTVTGAVEVAAAALLMFRRTRFSGAFLGVGTMAGAMLIHAVFAEWSALAAPVVLFALFAIVGWATRPSWILFTGEPSKQRASSGR